MRCIFFSINIYFEIHTGIHTTSVENIASNRRSIVTGGKRPHKIFICQESKLSCNNKQSRAGVGKHYPHNCVMVTIILCFCLDVGQNYYLNSEGNALCVFLNTSATIWPCFAIRMYVCTSSSTVTVLLLNHHVVLVSSGMIVMITQASWQHCSNYP